MNKNFIIHCNECKKQISKTELIECNGKCELCHSKAINEN